VELDVLTRGVLKLFVLPPGALLLMLLVGLFFAKRVLGRMLISTAFLGLYLLSTPVLLHTLAGQVETIAPPDPSKLRDSGAEAILVLMAGVQRINPELGGASALSTLSLERVDYGLALHRRTGLPILLSGGSVRGDSQPLAKLGAAWLQNRAEVTAVAIDSESRDTWENTQNSAEELRRLGLKRVLLVTHAFHMPRAMFSARAAEIDAVPAPFGFEHLPADLAPPTRFVDWLPHPGILGRNYLIFHEMVGMLWYRLVF